MRMLNTAGSGYRTHEKVTAGDERLAATIAAYDDMAAEYSNRFSDTDLGEHRLAFQGALRGSLPVLDAGCGAGRDCSLFERDGQSPIGVDLSTGLLREAARVTRAPLVVGDLRRLPFESSSFSGVWCCAVLLHLNPTDALVALKQMFRVLVSDGPLFLSVRAGEGNHWREDSLGSRRWFYHYSREELRTVVEEAGFFISRIFLEPGIDAAGDWINLHAHRP